MFLSGVIEKRAGRFTVRTFLIFFVVFVTIKAGLWLTVPPYYTSPIWFGSGIAVGLALLFGIRCLYAIIMAFFLGFYTHSYYSVELFVSPLLIASGGCMDHHGSAFLPFKYVYNLKQRTLL